MRMTKFGHSCVRLEKDGSALAIDPGVFSQTAQALDGVAAVLITHEHPDHLDVAALASAVGADVTVRAPAPVAAKLAENPAFRGTVTAVGPDEEFGLAGFAVRTVGGQHALIHPRIPVVANVGYLIDGALYHPGDSLIVPTVPVDTALLPIHAPWSKVGEVIDFAVSLRARQAFQIHDRLLSEAGLGMVEGHVGRFVAERGGEFRHLADLETAEV